MPDEILLVSTKNVLVNPGLSFENVMYPEVPTPKYIFEYNPSP